MTPPTILRVRRTDVDAQSNQPYVLVSVQATGPHPLDLKLVATEGENVYPTSIRHKKVKDLQLRPAYKGSDAEWEAILTRQLLKRPVDASNHGATASSNDIEILSAVSDRRLTLTLRKNIGGITQRIGAIHLPENNDEEISLFDWTVAARDEADREHAELGDLQTRYEELQEKCRRFEAQLQDLVQAKQNHETALLAKFEQLLNAKKLKIRDQQRLLAGAKVDPVAAAAVEGARQSTRGRRRAGPSRPNKRQASNGAESESDSTFEPRKPKPVDDDDETSEPELTPQESDQDETEDEQDGNMSEDACVPGAAKPGEASKKKATETVAGNGNSPEQRKPDSLHSPPPRRELPFARKNDQGKSGKQLRSTAEVEDDTTDDEL
ncbi:uncharacterized protein J3D65DRAFT_631501 [Phyllosticta citribraziliensis]|uniref:Uncharacterized protein n=1 Tax=Phyllosticta citribraziliensis TaxID=989973 RepID=A0ABR1LF37_9PEZI